MSIQQSINQMLYTGTIAAGLYSHSPAGQAAFAKRQAGKAGKSEEKAIAKGDTATAEAAAAEKQKYLSRAAAVNPTYANLLAAAQQVGPTETETKEIRNIVPSKTERGKALNTDLRTKEGRAIKSLYDRDKTLVEQKEYFKQLMGDIIEYDTEVKGYGE